MSNSFVNVQIRNSDIVIHLEDTWENWTDLTIEESRDLARRLNNAADDLEKGIVYVTIQDAVERISVERYGMTVKDHEELDKVLKAMNGYLDYVAKKQEGTKE